MAETGKNLCPYKDGLDNLGKKGKAWGDTHTKNLYVTGTAEAQTLTVGGEATIPGYVKDVTKSGSTITVTKSGNVTSEFSIDQLNTTLNALKALTPTADHFPYFTGTDKAGLASLSTFMRGIMGKTTADEVREAIGAVTESGAGIVAGDVSNADAWWVKLGGTIPLIIQGGVKPKKTTKFTYPISLNTLQYINFIAKRSSSTANAYCYTYNVTNKSAEILAIDEESYFIVIGT